MNDKGEPGEATERNKSNTKIILGLYAENDYNVANKVTYFGWSDLEGYFAEIKVEEEPKEGHKIVSGFTMNYSQVLNGRKTNK